jgi:hypothetical protein
VAALREIVARQVGRHHVLDGHIVLHTANWKLRDGLDLRRNFFTNRVVKDWNKIPLEVREVKTVINLKNAYALHQARMVEST